MWKAGDEQWARLQGARAEGAVGRGLALRKGLEAPWKGAAPSPGRLIPRSEASTHDAFVHIERCPAQ